MKEPPVTGATCKPMPLLRLPIGNGGSNVSFLCMSLKTRIWGFHFPHQGDESWFKGGEA
jgi:hypothetical protein